MQIPFKPTPQQLSLLEKSDRGLEALKDPFLEGVIEKETGQIPFNTPPAVLNSICDMSLADGGSRQSDLAAERTVDLLNWRLATGYCLIQKNTADCRLATGDWLLTTGY